jgi:tetratricopeptide (TPR) repeat protein
VKIPRRLVSWWERLIRWAEWIAAFLRKYFLILVGSGLVLASVVLKWVQFPLSHNLSGLKFSLLRDPGITAHISLFSVGVIGAMILAGALIFWRKNYSLLALAAAFLLMLWAVTPTQIAFREPSMLRRLSYELQAAPELNVFAKDYLPQNYGTPELVPTRLILYTAWGRLLAAWSFLRLGWYLFGIGALLIACYAISKLPMAQLSTAVILLCLPLGALIILLIPPAIGQHYYSAGLLAKTEGHNQEAIADFRRAMRWDSWHAGDIDLYATIGQLQKQAGIDFNSPERHVSRAVEFRDASHFEPAMFEFGRAAEAGGALAETARREAALTRINYGIALYRDGAVGSAVSNWQHAIAEDPNQIYALPYLVRGYYEIGRYQTGIATANRLVDLIRDHTFAVANVYSMVGDCYAKLGDDANARKYYNLSLTSDPILNYWALTGLAGQ